VKNLLKLARSPRTVATKALEEYTEEKFDLSKCDMGKEGEDISACGPLPSTPPMGSTPAGPSKTAASKVKHVAKRVLGKSGPSQPKPHSASQSGPSQANPHPAPQMPSNLKIPPGKGIHLPMPKDGTCGRSFMGIEPTLYIRNW
jgi:hypothetical protein